TGGRDGKRIVAERGGCELPPPGNEISYRKGVRMSAERVLRNSCCCSTVRFRRKRRQQGGRDRSPFRMEIAAADRPVGTAIPITGIGYVAFLAMQIGVDPGRCRVRFILLGVFVRPFPI